MSSYKDQLIKALQEGILLLVKYGLIIAAIIYGFNFSLGTRDLAVQSNVLIREFQVKGWLPAFVNNQVPEKPKELEKK